MAMTLVSGNPLPSLALESLSTLDSSRNSHLVIA